MMSDVMLRPHDVMVRTGLSRTTIWRGVRAGTFPAPLELGENSIGWLESVIDDWLKSRPRRNYADDAAYRKSHLSPPKIGAGRTEDTPHEAAT